MSEFSIRTQPFRLGLKDYRALWLAEATRPSRILFILTVVVVSGILLLTGKGTPRYLWMLAVYLVAVSGFATLALNLLWRRLRQDPLASGERILLLDSGAVRLIGYGVDTRRAWSAVDGIAQSRDHLFVFTPGQETLVLPKRALASSDETGRVVKLARMAIRSARQTGSVLPALTETPDNREVWRSRPYRMLFQRPLPQVVLKILVIVISLPVFSFLVVLFESGGRFKAGLSFFIVILALTALFASAFLFTLCLAWLVFRRMPSRRGDREVCFTRDYVRCTNPLLDSRLDWANVREVRQAAGVFIFQLASGWFHVPSSAFATKADAMAFFTQAVAFWRAAEARR